ncbi:MAG: PAS domain-containing protein [Bryobacteraceae bacterium]
MQIFRASPLMALALCLCLLTILWCIRLTGRQQGKLDKMLTGLLGLIAIYEALRVLKDSGIVFHNIRRLDDWSDFLIAGLCMVAALILRFSSRERISAKACLRLVEANEKVVDPGSGSGMLSQAAHAVFDASPLATFAVNMNGAVTYWNAAAEGMLGWKRDEVLGFRLPFALDGPILHHRGHQIEAAIWTSPIRTYSGAARARLMIVADRGALREAGVADVHWQAKTPLAG